MEKPNPTAKALQGNASADSTAMRALKATKMHDAALLVSAFASLITALTGVAVLLLH
ncbi:hypothetical protein [Streptomyces sp. NPDC047829]|uniref:hypothetical protein n=1 Tax=Streptomyces sp. NPDC047829 TaxID=3154609 RepID=UPI0033DFD3C1